MTEKDIFRKVEGLLEAIQEGRRHLEMIGMTREERSAIEQQLDRIYARLDVAREQLPHLRLPAS